MAATSHFFMLRRGASNNKAHGHDHHAHGRHNKRRTGDSLDMTPGRDHHVSFYSDHSRETSPSKSSKHKDLGKSTALTRTMTTTERMVPRIVLPPANLESHGEDESSEEEYDWKGDGKGSMRREADGEEGEAWKKQGPGKSINGDDLEEILETFIDEEHSKEVAAGQPAQVPEKRTSAALKKAVTSLRLVKEEAATQARAAIEDWYREHVISPISPFKRGWDTFIALAILYVAIVVPYEACFLSIDKELRSSFVHTPYDDGTGKQALDVVGFILDVLFIADLFLNFFTAIQVGGVLIKEQKMIVPLYLNTWFIVDLIASVPFDLILIGGGGGTSWASISLVKCTRLLRLGRLTRKLDAFTAANVFRIVKMVASFVLFGHWGACGLFYVGVAYQTKGVDGELRSWVHEGRSMILLDGGLKIEDVGVWDYYEMSYYFAITTVTTTGYGDLSPITTPERRYIVILQIIGAVVYAVVFGNVAVLISSFDASYQRYRDRMDLMNEFGDSNALPSDLRERMRGYVSYVWNINHGIEARDMLQELPYHLQVDIYMELYADMIMAVPMFMDAEEGIIKSLVMRLVMQVVFKGDVIVKNGDVGREMFFIRRGSVAVMSGDLEICYAHLAAGSFFGEISLVTGGRRTATVVAEEMTEIYSLAKEDFDDVLRDFPDARKKFRKVAAGRLKQNLKLRRVETKSTRTAVERASNGSYEGGEGSYEGGEGDGSGVASEGRTMAQNADLAVARHDSLTGSGNGSAEVAARLAVANAAAVEEDARSKSKVPRFASNKVDPREAGEEGLGGEDEEDSFLFSNDTVGLHTPGKIKARRGEALLGDPTALNLNSKPTRTSAGFRV
mmetsp:Transcript_62148/g.196579  ORF Transcript_62148/g.196579 Transcript_62148/m.196579 type:complete len:846 (-) Transcript_62148:44-2581(-)